MNLGDKIRAGREALGHDGKTFAKIVGISPAYLSEVETGKKEPRISVLRAIAAALRVDTGSLLSEFVELTEWTDRGAITHHLNPDGGLAAVNGADDRRVGLIETRCELDALGAEAGALLTVGAGDWGHGSIVVAAAHGRRELRAVREVGGLILLVPLVPDADVVQYDATRWTIEAVIDSVIRHDPTVTFT